MSSMNSIKRLAALGILVSGVISLNACAPLVVGGAAATTAVVATDRRTAGEQVEDQSIELKVASRMRQLVDGKGRVNATSYAGVVLLTGDVPDESTKAKATEEAQKVEMVKKVYNQLRVGDITPISVRSNDTWITSKVKTALINAKEVPTRTMTVTTERGNVYLMGRVTEPEAQRAVKVVSGVKDVNKVVRAFEIISEETLAKYTEEDKKKEANSQSESNDSGVEAIPIE